MDESDPTFSTDTCQDIRSSNIMLGLGDDSVLEAFELDEAANPSLRNVYPDRIVYQSRSIAMPRVIGLPVLSDFGLTRLNGGRGLDDIQPEIYRAPEVLLDMDWTCSVDIWNIGTMVRLFKRTYPRFRSPTSDLGHVLQQEPF